MKHRSTLYIFVFAVIILTAACPFIFRDKSESINQTLNLSATIVSSLAAVATLLIALLLFNKYGVESPLIEKSATKVFDLLEHIKATRFSFDNNKLWFNVWMSDPFKHHKSFEEYYNQTLIFSDSYMSNLEKIFEIGSNPFMPTSIFEKLDQLQFSVLYFDIKENEENNYLKVWVMGYKKTDSIKFGRFNGKDMTVFEFLSILDDIKQSIEKWISDNSAIRIKLNL